MAASDHLGAQFSPFVQRMADIKAALPKVSGMHRPDAPSSHDERLGVVRAYAHSSVPVEDVSKVSHVVTRTPGVAENEAYTEPEERRIQLGASMAGTSVSRSGQYALVHETGHVVGATRNLRDAMFGNQGKAEAMAENYADTHAIPHQSLYDAATPNKAAAGENLGWNYREYNSYKHHRQTGKMP